MLTKLRFLILFSDCFLFNKEADINFDPKLQTMIRAAEDKKAEKIVALDFENVEGVINDLFLICSGSSERQVKAIADNIHLFMKKEGFYPTHTEGATLSQWILMDYGDIIVHVFLDTARDFYRLEDLWHSAKQIYPKKTD